jgi:hypothetical protein
MGTFDYVTPCRHSPAFVLFLPRFLAAHRTALVVPELVPSLAFVSVVPRAQWQLAFQIKHDIVSAFSLAQAILSFHVPAMMVGS